MHHFLSLSLSPSVLLHEHCFSSSRLITAAPNDPHNHSTYIPTSLPHFLPCNNHLNNLSTSPVLSQMAPQSIIFLFGMVLLLSLSYLSQAISTDMQPQFFTLMKQSVSGKSLAEWNVSAEGKPYCNFRGVGCDDQGYVIQIDVTGWGLSGHFPADVCSYLPKLRVLRLSYNRFIGNFPYSIVNCSVLEELSMHHLNQTGPLPDFSPLKFLRILDLSDNLFGGNFPISVTNLTNLEVLSFNENPGFNLWQLPENISRLTKLKRMVLSTCKVQGLIPATIGDMTSLVDLELSGNYLVGQIPKEIGLLKNLQLLELYYNQLSGYIPEEIGNLTELIDLDMSVNKLQGKIPESICSLPKLQVLQLYNNSLSGEIPGVIANSTTLTTLSLYANFLTGKVPQNLGQSSSMVVLDLSENNLTGPLPPEVCKGGQLLYLLFLQNMFSGNLPESYTKCESVLRFRVSKNRLEGSIPEGLLSLPHASIIDLGDNNFTGPIADRIGYPRNLSELLLQGNKISGAIPPSISRATNLVKIDLSNNLLSGPIPSEIGNLRKLNALFLQGNKLSSSIPSSLSWLKSLNVLDLSNNLLTGSIPESLSELLPNSINFSNNNLSGPIPVSLVKGGLVESFSGNPGLCVSVNVYSSDQNFPTCPQPSNRKKLNSIWVIGISIALIVLGAVLFLKRRFSQQRASIEHDETMSSSFFSYDVKSFHRISFDQREVIEAMVDKNIVGHGGSGTVYRIDLSSGDVIAVKRLWSRKAKDTASEDQLFLDKALKTEVETLGSIRHINIVKLYCYFSSLDCSLLVYEYMPNEYAYSPKATTKCDVYSFGVVLMELITGKKPVEPEFGEGKNIAFWVSNKVDTKEGAFEVLDNRLSGSFRDEMIQVLRIAIRCTYKSPARRPTMKEVVQSLIEATPCRFDSYKLSNKTKETPNVTKIKNQFDL
ncbi:receptor protein-tyrosine kinase cepr1 [Quercus suber]|uniref:Receptor protein-tyrosine kinase cepr1 n=1 Tax=Quercus suber TaxID=58331 RepID=A0AAW0KRJ7_QUESU